MPAIRRGVLIVVSVTAAIAVALGLGLTTPAHPYYALLGAGAVLALGLSLGEPAFIPLLACPLIVVSTRVAALGVDFTVSDVALALASLSAFVAAYRGVDRPTRQILWLIALYQFVTIFALLNHIYRANVIEWVHAGVLTAGGLLVGWTVGARGYARLGLRLLILATGLIALGTLALAARNVLAGNFDAVYPSWPWAMHKNLAGTILALGAITCYVRPAWSGLSRWQARTAFYGFAAALLATQSRQAMIGLALAITIVAVGRRPETRRSRVALVIAVALLMLAWVMIRDQLRSGNEFNSINTRSTFYRAAIQMWRQDPWFGAGLRWWYTDRYDLAFQPPNAELEVLTTVGLVGLAAFLVQLLGMWVAIRKLDPDYGMLALMVLVVRVTQSQFDIYWVSIQASLPFVLIGICLGARAHASGEVPWLARRHRESPTAPFPQPAGSRP